MTRYVAVIARENGIYGIVFPDLPGCMAAGITIGMALNNASGALRDWLGAAEEAGVNIPVPRTLERLRQDAGIARALAAGATLASIHASPPEKNGL